MNPVKNILLVISIGRDHSQALKRAKELAKKNQASLSVVAVVTPPPGYTLLSKTNSSFKNLLDEEIAHTRERLGDLCDGDIRSDVLVGKTDLEIVREVERNGHDLVLKSCEETRGIKSALFGSVDMNLMRKCPCPVLIAKPSPQEHFGMIVAAVDRDDDSPENHLLNLRILELSSWLALAESGELHIVHAWTMPFESLLRSPRGSFSKEEVDAMANKEEAGRILWLRDLLDEFAKENKSAIDYLSPQIHTIKGSASFQIPEKLRELNADLIVMGTVGRVGVQGLMMGNTSEAILQNAECSGLTVKPPGFQSPLSS